jgi:FAD/FMN-containing dehydrogenase
MALAKRTSSNLFRYRPGREEQRVDLSAYNRVLKVDAQRKLLEVQGLATYESVVDATLPHGLAPLVTPELKHITVGGAIVGIGIESTCYRHGFVHDGLVEAEVLLPGGETVLARADNEHAELFRALPNSYGTLGYILRATMRLMPAQPCVHLRTERFDDLDAFLAAMQAATGRGDIDFVEGLLYSERRLLLTLSRFVAAAPRVDDIYRNVFYRMLEEREDLWLTAKDYLFRYDPDWFWNLPETGPYRLFRRLAPRAMRNSGFYKRYVDTKNRFFGKRDQGLEPLIQDWEVPWGKAAELTRFALREVDLEGKPWIVTPIRTGASPTLYPVQPGVLYYNFGCYTHVRKRAGGGEYYATRLIDDKCFGLGGIKMLYSSTFLPRAEFDRIYNGAAYARAKARYDPQGRRLTLFEKCALPPGAPARTGTSGSSGSSPS